MKREHTACHGLVGPPSAINTGLTAGQFAAWQSLKEIKRGTMPPLCQTLDRLFVWD
jgi:hypothetical protein